MRWQAQRDTAWEGTPRLVIQMHFRRAKAPSPLRSAGAVQDALVSAATTLSPINCRAANIHAFSGDSIPVHLLTLQAVQQYLDRTAPDGVVALHVSNSHLDLRPVVAGIATGSE